MSATVETTPVDVMASNPETPEPTMAGVVRTVLTFVVGADSKMSRVAVRTTSRVDVI